MRILVTGATGYVGGRLVPRLLDLGHEVTVIVRDAARLSDRSWAPRVTVLVGDLTDPATSFPPPANPFDLAFYLVHSLGSGSDFDRQDQEAAERFAQSFPDIPHVVYLGGLLPSGRSSHHLRSRAATGAVLASHYKVTEFRAGPVIGSGSASFEMVRYLTERLPVMIAPKWIKNLVQPIGIRDLLAYLVAILDRPPLGIVEVGGEVLSFRDMLRGYARVQGLPRKIIAVPFLLPGLAAHWVGLVTPIRPRIARPLVAGIVEPVIADLSQARKHFPLIEPADYATAIRRADDRQRLDLVETRWAHAARREASDFYTVTDREGVFREVRRVSTSAAPSAVFASFAGIGGDRGYLVWNWAWKLRAWVDLALGGPGLRRGRNDPDLLQRGDHLDFWRVESVEPGHRLVLRAEMRNPGHGWLSWEVESQPDGSTCLTQTALFRPRGLGGLLYWGALYIPHRMIFSGMARAIARQAEVRPRA